jgi:hypothetical protein
MKSITYRYRVEVKKTKNGTMSGFGFDSHYGKADYAGLSAMVKAVNASFEFGGIGFTGYPAMKITEANLVDQKTGKVVAKYTTELFFVE